MLRNRLLCVSKLGHTLVRPTTTHCDNYALNSRQLCSESKNIPTPRANVQKPEPRKQPSTGSSRNTEKSPTPQQTNPKHLQQTSAPRSSTSAISNVDRYGKRDSTTNRMKGNALQPRERKPPAVNQGGSNIGSNRLNVFNIICTEGDRREMENNPEIASRRMLNKFSSLKEKMSASEAETSLTRLINLLSQTVDGSNWSRLYPNLIKDVMLAALAVLPPDSKYLQSQFEFLISQLDMYGVSEVASFSDLPWVINLCVSRVDVSLPNIISTNELVSAYLVYAVKGATDPNSLFLLQQKTLELTAKLTSKDIVRIFSALQALKLRNMDQITRLVNQLKAHPTVLTVNQLMKLFYSWAALKITNSDMLITLELLCYEAMVQQLHNKPRQVVSIITSMGKLYWHQPDLLTALSGCLRNHLSNLSVKQFRSILSTCASMEIFPECLHPAVPTMLKKARENPKDLLDIVWNMVMLGVSSEPIMREIIDRKFMDRLELNSEDPTVPYIHAKLLNIATACCVEFGGDIPVHMLKFHRSPPVNQLQTVSINNMRAKVVQLLNADIAYIETCVWKPTGHVLDLRFLIDISSGTTASPVEYKAPLEVSEKKEPSDTMKWVAVLLTRFTDYTNTTSTEQRQLVGRKQLAVTQLQQIGYHVVRLDHNSLNDCTDQQSWLAKQLKDVLPNHQVAMHIGKPTAVDLHSKQSSEVYTATEKPSQIDIATLKPTDVEVRSDKPTQVSEFVDEVNALDPCIGEKS